MKKIIFLFGFLLNSIVSFAQSTISYRLISSYCPQTGYMTGGGGATAITFYDGYISDLLWGNFYAANRNNDGSITYKPRQMAGSPALQVDAILISADRSQMIIYQTSSMGYMSINMIDRYNSIGEDGGRAAQQILEAEMAARRGGSSYSDRNSSNNSNRTCTSCGGTGVSKTPNTGGSRTSWVAHYNSSGSRCPYCGSYTQHFHNRCSSCNVPRY